MKTGGGRGGPGGGGRTGTGTGKGCCAGRGRAGTKSSISGILGFLGKFLLARTEQRTAGAGTIERIYGQDIADCVVPLRKLPKDISSQDSEVKRRRFVACVVFEKCVACGMCVQTCPVGAVTITRKVALVDPGRCTGCGQCVTECPQQALVLRKA